MVLIVAIISSTSILYYERGCNLWASKMHRTYQMKFMQTMPLAVYPNRSSPIWSDTTTLTATVVFFFPSSICNILQYVLVPGHEGMQKLFSVTEMDHSLMGPSAYQLVPTTLIPNWLFFVTLWIPLVICAIAMEHRKFASTDPLSMGHVSLLFNDQRQRFTQRPRPGKLFPSLTTFPMILTIAGEPGLPMPLVAWNQLVMLLYSNPQPDRIVKSC